MTLKPTTLYKHECPFKTAWLGLAAKHTSNSFLNTYLGMKSLFAPWMGGENMGFLSDEVEEDEDGGGMNKPVDW